MNLTCGVEFHGNWVPTMEWKEHSIHGDKVLSVGINTTKANQRVSSTLIIAVQMGSRNYTCATKFDISDRLRSTTATNVPENIQVHTFTKSQGTSTVTILSIFLHL